MKAPTVHRRVLLYFLATSLVLFGITAHRVTAQEDPDPPLAPEATSEVSQSCGECHIDITINWETSPHAGTFHSEAFQNALSDGIDTTCYACHTTGYTPFNGEYSHEGVTCQACHGQTPENHPDEPVAVLPGLEVCASCHVATYQEWQVSAHGNAEIPCTSCHDPHEQAFRFETVQDLCLNCHQEERTDYAHVTHEGEMCSDCHLHRGTFDADLHLLTGDLGTSGHDAVVDTLACLDCHSSLDEGFAVADNTIGSGTELTFVTQELQTEIENMRAQGENEAAVRLMQGIVVGIAGGAVLMFLFFRLNPGRWSQEQRHDR